MTGFLHRDTVEPILKAGKRVKAPRRPLPRIGRKGRRIARELRAAKKIVRARSRGRCEITVDVWPHECNGQAVHYHHVQRRGQGGPNVDTNLVHICDMLHWEIHEHPLSAYGAGLLVRGSS